MFLLHVHNTLVLLLALGSITVAEARTRVECGGTELPGDGEPQTSTCPYIVLSPRTYFYTDNKELDFWLMPTSGQAEQFTIFNIRICDDEGINQGEFREQEGNVKVCPGGKMVTHRSENSPSTRVVVKWRAPSGDVGRLYINFDVGQSREKYWLNCGQIPLDFIEALPPTAPDIGPFTNPPVTTSAPGVNKPWAQYNRPATRYSRHKKGRKIYQKPKY